jgi:hypothetical protein
MEATHSVYDRIQGEWVYNEAAMWAAFDITVESHSWISIR